MCFAGLRERLLRCEVEHFGLDRSADWSPFTPEGVVSHLHAANLLGVVEVLLEDICMDCAALTPDAPAQVRQRELLCCACPRKGRPCLHVHG